MSKTNIIELRLLKKADFDWEDLDFFVYNDWKLHATKKHPDFHVVVRKNAPLSEILKYES